jgi:hypothetical protein
MGPLPVSLYLGDYFDTNIAAVVPKNPDHLASIWAFCSSPDFREAVRRIEPAMKATNSALVKVSFDLARWKRIADEQYPHGLPAPTTNDPTQWLFQGNPVGSANALQVAAARLLGYRWPNQRQDTLDSCVDDDGLVCIPPVAGATTAVGALREILAAAFGADWRSQREQELIASAGYGGISLDRYIRDAFFEQHCRTFRNRPFIWQVWDGRSDGFSALINYHRLDGPLLDRLIYTYLGAWIDAQRAAAQSGTPGADGRLVAALDLQRRLKLIREGEAPYDIYVRWKPLHQQPIGWEPDLNDGVRLNIRPFVEAGVLRRKFTINWNKDRGANPDGSERINDRHVTLAEKRAARAAHGVPARW